MIQLTDDAPVQSTGFRINPSFTEESSRKSMTSNYTTSTSAQFGGLDQSTVLSGATITARAYSIF